jgi:mono/diheme cytochrome c family protein
MRNWKKNTLWMLLGMAIAGVLLIGIPLAVLASGMVDFSASTPAPWIERTLAPWALEQSTEHHALGVKNPFTGKPEALPAGLAIYRQDCLPCHSAPGSSPQRWARGLNPEAPRLSTADLSPGSDLAEDSDGELFYVIKAGIRMTGMPAFAEVLNDTQIWQTLAFVKHLRDLTDAETAALQAKPAEKK